MCHLLLVMGTIGMTLGRVDGIILLVCFAGYIFYLIRHTLKQNRQSSDEEIDEIPLISMPKAVIFILIGAVGIAVGGDVVVDSASRIAIDLGMSQTLVGLTIVSIGTSLPELVTSIVAARKTRSIWHSEMQSAHAFSTYSWCSELHQPSAR